ncbi:uncharacterized protein LOC143044462 [Mytilus galloprovincialis]|uniref:uncharacterized protein LOC143044462 n=1 Tax=Mytilus galloprovincialis TaxID=29158 RepID=UPI003F7BDBD3
MFSCFYGNYHNKRSCIDIIKMMIHSTMNKKITDDCLVKQSKRLCIDGNGNNSCNKTSCRVVLASAIDSLHNQRDQKVNEKDSQNCDDDTSSNTDDVNKSRNGKEKEKDKGKNKTESIFKVGAIVGISVGITGTIILFLIILVIIFVCRRRSKKKKRKHLTRQQAINQRLAIEKYESGSFSTNKGGNNVLSAKIPFKTDEAQGKYFVPSITKYDKELSNRKLPEIKRCSGAEGDDNVYYEIDEDKIKSSTDIDGVYQNKIKEFTDKSSYHSDQTRSEIQLGLMKKKMEQLTKQQSIDQRSEIASLESSIFSTNNRENTNTILFANESLNTDEEQGEYFVLDPFITKYDKDLSKLDLPEIKRFSVAQDDERVYNEIDEDEVQPPTDMKGVRQKKIEVKVKCSGNGDKNMYEIPRSTKDTNKQQTRPQSVDQRTEIDIQNSSSGDKVIMSVNESLNTDEEQGEYFVLDPSVTKYDRDISNLVLPEVKRFSVAQGDENVYNEINEDRIESSPVIKVDQQKQIEDVRDIVIYHTDHINHGTQSGFDNTAYHVASEIDDKSF